MTHVDVKDGNIENALKRFKVKVQRSGILSECKKRKEYVKPGVRDKLAKKEGIKNAKKRNKKNREG